MPVDVEPQQKRRDKIVRCWWVFPFERYRETTCSLVGWSKHRKCSDAPKFLRWSARIRGNIDKDLKPNHFRLKNIL